MGIEPTPSAWKAEVLPLNYTRTKDNRKQTQMICLLISSILEGGGFEPPKAKPPDLQSGPFDRSGTPPQIQAAYFAKVRPHCQYKDDVIRPFFK